MVLYTIVGIFVVGMIFFGVGFKIGSKEGFASQQKPVQQKPVQQKPVQQVPKQQLQDMKKHKLNILKQKEELKKQYAKLQQVRR